MNQEVGGGDGADELPVVDRLVLEPRVGGFDENLGIVARRPEHPLDAEDLVSDRIAVAERGQDLVDAACPERSRRAGAHALTSL